MYYIGFSEKRNDRDDVHIQDGSIKSTFFRSNMDEDSSRPRYVERKGENLHPAVDRKRLNMIIIFIHFTNESIKDCGRKFKCMRFASYVALVEENVTSLNEMLKQLNKSRKLRNKE